MNLNTSRAEELRMSETVSEKNEDKQQFCDYQLVKEQQNSASIIFQTPLLHFSQDMINPQTHQLNTPEIQLLSENSDQFNITDSVNKILSDLVSNSISVLVQQEEASKCSQSSCQISNINDRDGEDNKENESLNYGIIPNLSYPQSPCRSSSPSRVFKQTQSNVSSSKSLSKNDENENSALKCKNSKSSPLNSTQNLQVNQNQNNVYSNKQLKESNSVINGQINQISSPFRERNQNTSCQQNSQSVSQYNCSSTLGSMNSSLSNQPAEKRETTSAQLKSSHSQIQAVSLINNEPLILQSNHKFEQQESEKQQLKQEEEDQKNYESSSLLKSEIQINSNTNDYLKVEQILESENIKNNSQINDEQTINNNEFIQNQNSSEIIIEKEQLESNEEQQLKINTEVIIEQNNEINLACTYPNQVQQNSNNDENNQYQMNNEQKVNKGEENQCENENQEIINASQSLIDQITNLDNFNQNSTFIEIQETLNSILNTVEIKNQETNKINEQLNQTTIQEQNDDQQSTQNENISINLNEEKEEELESNDDSQVEIYPLIGTEEDDEEEEDQQLEVNNNAQIINEEIIQENQIEKIEENNQILIQNYIENKESEDKENQENESINSDEIKKSIDEQIELQINQEKENQDNQNEDNYDQNKENNNNNNDDEDQNKENMNNNNDDDQNKENNNNNEIDQNKENENYDYENIQQQDDDSEIEQSETIKHLESYQSIIRETDSYLDQLVMYMIKEKQTLTGIQNSIITKANNNSARSPTDSNNPSKQYSNESKYPPRQQNEDNEDYRYQDRGTRANTQQKQQQQQQQQSQQNQQKTNNNNKNYSQQSQQQNKVQQLYSHVNEILSLSIDSIKFGIVFPGNIFEEQVQISNKTSEMVFIKVVGLCLNPEFDSYGEYVYSIRKTINYDYNEKLMFSIPPYSCVKVHVALKVPNIAGEKILKGSFAVTVNGYDSYISIPITSSVEIPKILCTRQLFNSSRSSKVIKLAIRRGKKSDCKIPFKNTYGYSLQLEPFWLTDSTNEQHVTNIKDGSSCPFHLSLSPQLVTVQPKGLFMINLLLRPNQFFKEYNEKRILSGDKTPLHIKNILIIKIANSSILIHFPVSLEVY